MNKALLVLASVALCCMNADAQSGKYFDSERQLSSSFVSQVYVDHEGFLWATTRDGINRYDGYQFRVFKRENPADSTLYSNYVNCMMQDSRGLFYFGMYGALQTWDGSEFHNVAMKDAEGNNSYCYAQCFLERRNGDVLAGTSGLGVMKFSDSQNAQQIGGALAQLHTVSSMIEDRQERLWIATDRFGLVCYDGQTIRKYLQERNDLNGLCEDSYGTIYVGTSNSGVYMQQGEQFVHIEGTGTNAVSALYCDRNGRILIGYDGEGIAIFDPRDRQLTANPYFSMEVDLTRSKVYSFTEDTSGNLWIGMMQKGIYLQPASFRGFHYMGRKLGNQNTIGNAFVACATTDHLGRTWVGTDKDGIYCISADKKSVRHLKDGYPSVVMTLCEDSQGRIWAGSYQEGFGWIDGQTLQYHRQPYPDDHLIVMDIKIDSHQRLWMATMKYGLLCMDLNDQYITKYVADENAPSDRSINSISNDYASQLYLSPDEKRIYVSTSLGLCCLDIDSQSWTKAFGGNCLNYSQPTRLAKEFDGELWVGANTGLYRYDLSGHLIQHYTRADGLTDNGISSIERDLDGKLWLSTNHGLNRLDPKTNTFENYYVDDGLQSNEFGDNASCIAADGTIIMGGTGGLTWFNPKEIQHTPWKASVQLTGFFVNGMQVNASTLSDGHAITDTTVIASNHFQLGWHDNSFAIQLSTLTFDNPEHTTYLYSINNEPYIRLQQGMNVISFSHMPPGTYNFRVKAERNNETTEERAFTVVVGRPWYKSIWAYIIYALLAAIAIWSYLAFRRRKEQDHLRLQEHIHAEEMADAKLKFFINMSHEIRTPMTLIVTPLVELIKEEQDPQRRATYLTIKRNADRILGVINQMMDLRKIDKGQMQMRMTETDLVGFVKDIHDLFSHQARSKQINLTLEHDADRLPVWIDRRHFDKVIVNVLSNAFKFTPSGGNIDINITHDQNQAKIAISDDGEQIPPDQLERIFERFYQSPTRVNDRNTGTGVGLDLSRALVELHHGTITASNLSRGCQFVVTLPLGNAHLKPEEIVVEKNIDDSEKQQPDTAVISPAEEENNTEQETGNKRRAADRKVIVIAEDDDEIRQYLTEELGHDYTIHACANGREALGLIHRVHPDLVLSDVMMPEMDGTTLCQKLKINMTTNFIPVVLLTAKNSEEDRLEGLETGADAYISKPFNLDILKRTILNLINTHQLLRLKYERNDGLEEQITEVQRPKSPDEKLLERVMNAINNHLDDSDLSIDMIADEVGISRVHLHRKMKELTGQTPHDFIRNIRLKRAATLLAGHGMNVTEVMYACGFSNSTSFSTVFKKFYGMSPRDYMREHDKQ